jgi:hypothetical protein
MTETVFGAGTTTALVRMTIWCACLLLATTLTLAVLHHTHRAKTGGSLMRRSLATTPVAPSSPAAAQPAFPFASQPSAPTASKTTPATPAAPAAAQPAGTTPASSQSAPPPAAPAGKTP